MSTLELNTAPVAKKTTNKTTPEFAQQCKQQKVWNEDAKDTDLKTVYSQRGGWLSEDDSKVQHLGDIHAEIHARDDFGIVTIYTIKNGLPAHCYVERTNLGYSVRPFVNQTLLPSLIVKETALITQLFD